ncbi:MAG: hypothetical protein IH991_06920 [Planctomycetes bacterium]|nr:hypothetical protein [Planctomycetota bacterium]
MLHVLPPVSDFVSAITNILPMGLAILGTLFTALQALVHAIWTILRQVVTAVLTSLRALADVAIWQTVSNSTALLRQVQKLAQLARRGAILAWSKSTNARLSSAAEVAANVWPTSR